jgi:Flp pilus assembly protein TadG
MNLQGIKRLGAGVRGFMTSRTGAIAPMFALLAVPMVIGLGAAVDIGRATTSRNNLQDALDATGLALSHLPSSTPAATVQTDAQQWLNANLHDGSISNISLSVSTSTQQVTLTANATINTTFASLAGISQVPVVSHTTVQWGLSHIELALVLDNTGSMADDNKINTLMSSANSLVTTLATTANTSNDPNALKISVVPFSDTVNVGSSYQSANWITGVMPSAYGADEFSTPLTNRFSLFAATKTTWGGCVESRPQPYDVQDTAPNPSTPATMFIPFFAPDEPDDNTIVSGSSTRNGRTTYTYYTFPNNYLSETLNNGNWQQEEELVTKYITAPITGTNPSTGYQYGPNAGCSGLQSLLRLTTNTTAVQAKINAMNAIGDTNIPMGLMWGWHTLSPNAPFGDGVAYGTPNTTKIVVLLTDGMNTETNSGNPNASYYSGLGYIWQGRMGLNVNSTATQVQAAMDARQVLLCNNMKAQGIVIYTVQIDTPGTAPAALSGCASDSTKFYDVQDVSNLNSAFQSIAGSIGHLRITQ